ncbi:uncharacterized protein LOC126376169 [Pectinophora gossypiella]|nr:uncharacterized protein LOC126376169 [Pectinophora gossypiella]
MDVYGYPSYQYNQSDELTKQILAQQALASSVPYNRTIPEPHIMPPPSGAPWNVETVPWGMSSPPQIVQFSARPDDGKLPPVIHCKRKSMDLEPVIPAKQFITEEKMAAHLSGLHISSDYTSHSLSSSSMAQETMDLAMDGTSSGTSPGTSSLITEKLKGHKIVLSEEVKKLRDEPLLPASLIERLEKPRMSLVVWKPKEDILEKIKEEKKEDDKDLNGNDESVKRNGLLVPELPAMDVEM